MRSNCPLLILFLISLLVMVVFVQEGSTQDSWEISYPKEVGQMKIVELEEDKYWLLQTVASGVPITAQPILRVIEFDECGPGFAMEYTHPDLYGIRNIEKSFVDGDSIRIVLEINPKVFHSHSELNMLSIHRFDFGHHMKFLRADNVIRVLEFFKTKNDNYLAYVFLSYTDRSPQYAVFLLDQSFNIINYYENFVAYTITGSAIEVADGFIFATNLFLCKLDYDLNPVWTKEIDGFSYIGNFMATEDGFVARYIARAGPGLPNELALVKFNFQGDLLWTSQKLTDGSIPGFRYSMQRRQNGNIDVAVHQFDFTLRTSNDLQIIEINEQNGTTVGVENTRNNSLLPTFKFEDLHINSNGMRQIIIEPNENTHVLWNLFEFNACPLEIAGQTTDAIPFIINNSSNRNTISDELWSGSYVWTSKESTVSAQILCEQEFILEDLLPEDTTICESLGVTVDLSNIEFDILWEDQSNNKIRTFPASGRYTYKIDDCQVDFEETIEVTLESCACQYFMPNVFSPNKDGINDTFRVENHCDYINDFQVQIFNRWGGLVFESDDQFFEWDGSFNGSTLNVGVFVYVIKYTNNLEAQSYIKQGSITIVR